MCHWAIFYSVLIDYKAQLVLRKIEQKPWGFGPYCVHTGPMECHIALSNTRWCLVTQAHHLKLPCVSYWRKTNFLLVCTSLVHLPSCTCISILTGPLFGGYTDLMQRHTRIRVRGVRVPSTTPLTRYRVNHSLINVCEYTHSSECYHTQWNSS